MKKKLLSLVLAGAMVASTSVSAFASTENTKEVTTDGGTANVEIKGFVDSNEGVAPAGTISVSIPTSLQFQVNKDGDLTGSNIKVVNNGLDQVEIVAYEFTDNNPTSGITVQTPNQLNRDTELSRTAKDRSNVVLWIQGKSGENAYFKTGDASQNGIYDAKGGNKKDGITVSKLSGRDGSNNSETLELMGYAGKGKLSDSNGISDKFTLKLKVKKVTSDATSGVTSGETSGETSGKTSGVTSGVKL